MGTPDKNEKFEILSDLEGYQKRLENQWEAAKQSYQHKINRLLDDFVQENLADSPPDSNPLSNKPPLSSPPPTPHTQAPIEEPHIVRYRTEDPARENIEDMESLLARAEQVLGTRPVFKRRRLVAPEKPAALSLDWKNAPSSTWIWIKRLLAVITGATLVATAYFYFIHIPQETALPYLHTSGFLIKDGKMYVADWFRKALYVHQLKKGFPLISVENMPNDFLTGLAFTDKGLWSLDGFHHQLLEHAMNTEHPLLSKRDLEGKPVGLFFDGTDLWSMDDQEKKLFRYHGTDESDIKKEFSLPNITLSAFVVVKNKLWLLNNKSRELLVFRLDEPVKQLATFDLDRFVENAIPTGLSIQENTIWITTESPSKILKLNKKALKQTKKDDSF